MGLPLREEASYYHIMARRCTNIISESYITRAGWTWLRQEKYAMDGFGAPNFNQWRGRMYAITPPFINTSQSKEVDTRTTSTAEWFTPPEKSSIDEQRGRSESCELFQSLSSFSAMTQLHTSNIEMKMKKSWPFFQTQISRSLQTWSRINT